jgi:hypothetical protein
MTGCCVSANSPTPHVFSAATRKAYAWPTDRLSMVNSSWSPDVVAPAEIHVRLARLTALDDVTTDWRTAVVGRRIPAERHRRLRAALHLQILRSIGFLCNNRSGNSWRTGLNSDSKTEFASERKKQKEVESQTSTRESLLRQGQFRYLCSVQLTCVWFKFIATGTCIVTSEFFYLTVACFVSINAESFD